MPRTVRTLATGIHFGEGPRWHEGRLWFSDFHAHAVMSVSLAGDVRAEFSIDDQPSGLGWMPDGSMLIVSMTKRQVLRRMVDGQMRCHADLSDIATWHCNDMVVSAGGHAYAGNFGFDLDGALAARRLSVPLDETRTAKLARIAPDGSVRVAASGLHFPNGSVITSDGATLILAETFANRLTAFDIAADGSLSNRRLWAGTGARLPDGICLDAEGAVWVANAALGECVRIAQGGQVLEAVATGDPCFACMLGGPDGKTLFMLTAPKSGKPQADHPPAGVLRIAAVDVPHAGLP